VIIFGTVVGRIGPHTVQEPLPVGVAGSMKQTLLKAIPVLAIAVIMSGCGGKEESAPVTVSSYTEYSDPVLKFAVRYPEGWKQTASQGKQVAFVSSSRVYDAFATFEPQGELGAKIEVGGGPGDDAAVDNSIQELRSTFTDASVLKGPEATTLNGMPAKKVSYSFDVGEVKFTVERFYVAKDSMMTYLETGVMGNFANYATVFDSVRASFRPAQPLQPAAGSTMPVDTTGGAVQPKDSDLVEAPAADMKSYSGSHFSISYPSNFEQGSAGAKGAMASVMFSGARNDSYFQVDVIAPPEGLDLDKIAEQNKKAYGGRAGTPTSVGGQKGYVFSYNPGKNVTSRAYFTMANNKLYRITMNWFTPQANLYQDAFQKALGSFRAK
jgi:hypothetical protein